MFSLTGRSFLKVFLLILSLAIAGPAQTGDGYDLSRTVIAGGGAKSTGGNFTLEGTAGQAVASETPSADAINSLYSGFWFSFLKLGQTISFDPIPGKTYGDASFPLAATASSGLPVSYSASGDCSVSGSTVMITGAGSCTVTAAQGGDGIYLPAAGVSQSFAITKAVLAVNPANRTITFGDPDPPFTYTYSGFVYGENESVIDSAPVCGVAVPHTDAGTYPITCAGGSDDNYDFTYNSATLTVETADQTITFDPLADKTYGDPAFDVSATASSGLPVSFGVTGNCSIAGTTITITGAGSCTVTASQSGNGNYNPAPDVSQSFTIGKATLTVTAEDKSSQYSDPLETLTWNFDGFVNGENESVVSGTPSVDTTATAASAPGSYLINIDLGSLSATDYEFAFVDGAYTILPEDARAYYTGSMFVNSSCPTCNDATVTLSATVKDITAVPGDPVTDSYPGDITNAEVSFVIRDGTNVIAEIPATVNLIEATDPTVGTALSVWNYDLPDNSDSESFEIEIVIGGYYTGATDSSGNADSMITISRPLGENFITGGGYLLLDNSIGQYQGTPGTRSNFGFNVKYNKSGKKLQGRLNLIIRSGGRRYQIKGNAMRTLVTNDPNADLRTAVYTGKANLQDVTDPNNPVSVLGNLTVQVNLTDRGEPGDEDSIAFTVWNGNGSLIFASNWNGTQTVEQTLAGGNLVIR